MLSGIYKQRSDPMSAMPKRTINHQVAFHNKRRHFMGTKPPESRHLRAGWQPHAAALPQICGEPIHVSELRLSSPCLRNEKSKQGAPQICSKLLLTLIVLAVYLRDICNLRKVGSHALVAMIFYMLLSPCFRTSAWSELTQGRNHFVLEFSTKKPLISALKGSSHLRKFGIPIIAAFVQRASIPTRIDARKQTTGNSTFCSASFVAPKVVVLRHQLCTKVSCVQRRFPRMPRFSICHTCSPLWLWQSRPISWTCVSSSQCFGPAQNCSCSAAFRPSAWNNPLSVLCNGILKSPAPWYGTTHSPNIAKYCPVPQKIALMIDPCHTWDVQYNARSNTNHSNITKILPLHEKWLSWLVFVTHTWAIQYTARSNSNHPPPPISPNNAPATKFWIQDLTQKSLNCFRQQKDDWRIIRG